MSYRDCYLWEPKMGEQWYCPQCGVLGEDSIDPVRSPVGLEEDEYFSCKECGDVVDQCIPSFVAQAYAELEAENRVWKLRWEGIKDSCAGDCAAMVINDIAAMPQPPSKEPAP